MDIFKQTDSEKLAGLRHMWDEAHDEMYRLTEAAVSAAKPLLYERYPVGSEVMVYGRGGDPERWTVAPESSAMPLLFNELAGGGTMQTHARHNPWRVYVTRKGPTTGAELFIYPLFSDVIPLAEWEEACLLHKP